MDFSVLEQSEQLAPLMIKLHDVYEEYKDDMFSTVFSQNRISDVVEELLLERGISKEEEEVVTEILIALVRDTEVKLRAALSDRISVIDGAPNKLALELANDVIDVARPVLENSFSLNDDDLVYLINTKETDHWQSIARRKKLEDGVINKLADTGDSSTYNALLKNFNVRLTQYSGEKIADRAKDEHFLVENLLERDELAKSIIMDIYQHVGMALQAQIAQKYGYESNELSDAINTISAEITEQEPPEATLNTVNLENEPDDFNGNSDLEQIISAASADNVDSHDDYSQSDEYQAALKYKKSGELTPAFMTRHLRRRQYKSFIAQLSVYSGIEPNLVRDILKQPHGQGLAVICKAMDVTKPDFMNIFLLTQPIRSKVSGSTQTGISKILDYYTRMNQDKAREVVENKFR